MIDRRNERPREQTAEQRALLIEDERGNKRVFYSFIIDRATMREWEMLNR